MYQLTLNDTPHIEVRFKNHSITYGLDGSLPNPLESTYAAIAGCAGVYARKACKALGISAEGIEIRSKPVVNSANPLVPKRIVTRIDFPAHITETEQEKILEEISHCAVKVLINAGSSIEFVTEAAVTA